MQKDGQTERQIDKQRDADRWADKEASIIDREKQINRQR